MMMGEMHLFISIVLGYGLCVVAKKQEGLLKTVGYTFGISILALSLVSAALISQVKCHYKGGMCICGMSHMKQGGMMMGKPCPMMKR